MLNQTNTDRETSREIETNEITNVLTAGVESCTKIDGLDAIKEAGTGLVIWHRTLAQDFKEWLKQLTPANLPHLRILVAPSNVRSALEPIFNENGLSRGAMQGLMIDDITNLASVFSRITKSKRVDIRLEHIKHDACWRFHVDNVETRLLTTYLGATTEWVNPRYAEQAIKEQKNFSGPLEHLSSNDVAIFKGKNAALDNGIVHRSPPIKGSGQSRLFLCLNEQSEVSPDPWDKV